MFEVKNHALVRAAGDSALKSGVHLELQAVSEPVDTSDKERGTGRVSE